MYDTVFEKLQTARKTMNSLEVRNAIGFFCQTIIDTINDKNIDYRSLYRFCEDKKLLFPCSDRNIYINNVQVHLRTNGLLSQILNEFGLTNFQELTNNVQNGLFTVQANIERKLDITLPINNLKDVLLTLQSAVQ